MKKIENWLKRSILASVGIFLILFGGNFLDFQMSEEAAYLSVGGTALFSVLFCSMSILMVLTGALGIHLGYKEWKKQKTQNRREEGKIMSKEAVWCIVIMAIALFFFGEFFGAF